MWLQDSYLQVWPKYAGEIFNFGYHAICKFQDDILADVEACGRKPGLEQKASLPVRLVCLLLRDVDKRGILGSAIPKWTDLIYLSPWQPTQCKAAVWGQQEGEAFINTAWLLYLCIPHTGTITFDSRMLLTITKEYHSCGLGLFTINKTA